MNTPVTVTPYMPPVSAIQPIVSGLMPLKAPFKKSLFLMIFLGVFSGTLLFCAGFLCGLWVHKTSPQLLNHTLTTNHLGQLILKNIPPHLTDQTSSYSPTPARTGTPLAASPVKTPTGSSAAVPNAPSSQPPVSETPPPGSHPPDAATSESPTTGDHTTDDPSHPKRMHAVELGSFVARDNAIDLVYTLSIQNIPAKVNVYRPSPKARPCFQVLSPQTFDTLAKAQAEAVKLFQKHGLSTRAIVLPLKSKSTRKASS